MIQPNSPSPTTEKPTTLSPLQTIARMLSALAVFTTLVIFLPEQSVQQHQQLAQSQPMGQSLVSTSGLFNNTGEASGHLIAANIPAGKNTALRNLTQL